MSYTRPIPELLKFLKDNKEYLVTTLIQRTKKGGQLQFRDKKNSLMVKINLSEEHYKEIDKNEKPNVQAVWDFIGKHFNKAVAGLI